MTIRKSDDIANDPNINERLKSDVARNDILERYNVTKTDNILPCDEGLAYLSEKVDECIDVINTNEGKTGITSDQASEIRTNTAKTGITSDQTSAIIANTAKTGITSDQTSAIIANTAKTGISSGQASAITANTAKTGISSSQTEAIVANTSKVSMVIGTRSTEAKAGDTTTISSEQASAITTNSAKTGISSSQASAITANTSKVTYNKDLSDSDGITLKATVTSNRGTYTLRFTMTEGETTKTADIVMR